MSPVKTASHQQFQHGAPVANGSGPARERSATAGAPQSPVAARATRRTWKDPRLLVGITIVAVSVLLGARLLATADDTVTVWSVRSDVPAGTPITAEDLQGAQLRFGSPELAGRYLPADSPLPEGAVLTRDLAAGELLPRDAVGDGGTVDLVEVPIALPADAVPATLRAGELVDVWVTPKAEAGEAPRALLVLEQVRVTAVPRSTSALGPSSTQQVVVGLPVDEQSRLAGALAQLSEGSAVIVRRG